MCEGCLDLVDAVVGKISAPIKGDRRSMIAMCDHTPFCGFRSLRPAERNDWMQRALPRTYTMIAMKERS